MRCSFDVAADHPAFDGHFPGQPVLPGVALLAEVLEAALDEPALAALRRRGAAPRSSASSSAPVRPGRGSRSSSTLGAKTLGWRIDEAGRAVASGQIARADLEARAAP